MERAVTVFPEPDSPTRATISFLSTAKEIFFTAFVVSRSEIKSMERDLIDKSGAIKFNTWVLNSTFDIPCSIFYTFLVRYSIPLAHKYTQLPLQRSHL